MYKYFCKLSLGLKFGDFYFGFTGYTMPMSKASKIWNKLSRSLSVIYVKRAVCLCLNPPSICMHIQGVQKESLQFQCLFSIVLCSSIKTETFTC